MTASEPGAESLENSSQGPPKDEAVLQGDQVTVSTSSDLMQAASSDMPAAHDEDLGSPMTEEEIADRDQLVTVARKGFDSALVANQALREIRDRKLFRETHKTFSEFCRDVLDISEARASQLINHAIQCAELKEHFSEEQIPTSERAVRELRRAPSAIRIKIIQKALELAAGDRPKTIHVQEARAVIEGVKYGADKTAKLQVITQEDAVSAAEILKQFLEKCDVEKLTLGNAKQISELTKGIADIVATRGLAA